ncbi:Predicted nucleic acid-binding protein, contains PIN domain [Haladaptatus litoreus]|uniref:Predicted nucleic acid-binding protein, contains PIN domain n=1 Tax=Haladaptatus litoreus TaxID=553468 RepID=A0A1N7EHP3_9EURY|nr:nucleic acid-binding protein [Haladaptatus litoreus]SIR87445.1 Predicted nucleic acid-binding protein, contains PIN domain [Haladaptatus litoreus]
MQSRIQAHLSTFAEIDALDLLTVIDELLIPETAYEELEESGIPPEFSDLEWEGIEVVDPVEITAELDAGERAALAVALERDNVVFLTDDLAAREFAQDQNIEVHGSIGIIALAYHREIVPSSEAASLMRSLQTETSLFITDAIVERGIELLQPNSE